MAQTEQQVYDKIKSWARARDDVRAVLITSSRTVPGAPVDAYSDYDVILIVRDVMAYAEETEWLEAFGDVVIAYWDPIEADETTGEPSSSNIVQYASGLDIDFGLWPESSLAKIVQNQELTEELDAGYRVLVDKDGVAAQLGSPTYRGYIPKPPDEATYLRLITDFYIGPPHIAKCLIRGDLVIAKWILDTDMRHVYLQPMLDWRVEIDHGWNHKPGTLGKGIQKVLPAALWHDVKATYVGADIDQNWDAMFLMMKTFGTAAREVGDALGYRYPQQLEDRVTQHVRAMRAGVFANGPLDDSA
ncbi:MAG TPA: aminoglycoside 6-adenylyltransferase [Microlunatus sp.]